MSDLKEKDYREDLDRYSNEYIRPNIARTVDQKILSMVIGRVIPWLKGEDVLEMGYQCCKELFEMGENVVGICSIPEEFSISYSATPVKNVTFRSFESLANRYGVPLIFITTKMYESNYIEIIQAWRPDFGLAIGWYYMVPRVVRELFPLGIAGVHAFLLPKYPGGSPLVWAIINGETKTGVTLFYFDGGVDTGETIAQVEINITRDDTIRTVYEKATHVSLDMLRRYIPLIRQGIAPRIQQDHKAATQFPQRKPEDGLLDWNKNAEENRNFIRVQTKPYPGAFTFIQGKKVIIWDADVFEKE